jgi:hypothetical protein
MNDFSLHPCSPRIDAGNDQVAPLQDLLDAPRFDMPFAKNCDDDISSPECDWIADISTYEYVGEATCDDG